MFCFEHENVIERELLVFIDPSINIELTCYKLASDIQPFRIT